MNKYTFVYWKAISLLCVIIIKKKLFLLKIKINKVKIKQNKKKMFFYRLIFQEKT